MKKSGIVTTLFLAMAFLMPFFMNAQTAARPSSDIKTSKRWAPIKLDANGGNVKDGVEFYSQPSECLNERADVVKLVNKNTYAVKVAFKTEASMPLQYVRVPAGASIEGMCGSADANLAKLVFTYPSDKTNDQVTKIKQYTISTIAISQFQ